jgi:hypothetical protein
LMIDKNVATEEDINNGNKRPPNDSYLTDLNRKEWVRLMKSEA